MNYSKTFLILSIAICIVSCKNRVATCDNVIAEHALEAEVLSLDVYFDIALVDIIDSFVVLSNTYNNTNLVHLYSISENRVTSSFVKQGNGPSEISHPGYCVIDKERKKIWYRDLGKGKMLSFDIYPADGEHNISTSIFDIPQGVMYLHSIYEDGLFFYSDYNMDTYISVFDTLGNVHNDKSIPNKTNISTLTNNELPNPYMAEYLFCKRPNNNLFAFSYKYSNVLVVVDEKGSVVDSYKGIIRKVDILEDDLETVYSYIKCNDDYVFCLMPRENGSSIKVFDWSLKPQAILNLDHSIFTFDIDKADFIYAFSSDTGELVRYKIDTLL